MFIYNIYNIYTCIYCHAYIAILANAFVMEVLGVGAVKMSFQRNHQIEENGHVTYVNFGVKWLGCNKKSVATTTVNKPMKLYHHI